MLRVLSILLFSLFATEASHAVTPVIDANLFYFSDTMSYSSKTSAYQRLFWDAMVGMPLTSKKTWILGWNYDSYSFSDNPGTATTLTITDMGPKLLTYFDKDRTWVLGLTYNLITTGAYSASGSTGIVLTGSSLRAEFGYSGVITEGVLIGARLNYYKASFNQKITNNATLTTVSDGRTAIYPSISFTFRFE